MENRSDRDFERPILFRGEKAMDGLTAGRIGGTERGFVNDSENVFTTFILFTKECKSLKQLYSFVNAGEQICSRTFTSVHDR